jgi:hypothetical protein
MTVDDCAVVPSGTIHFEETVQEIEDAYLEAQSGKPSSREWCRTCLCSTE